MSARPSSLPIDVLFDSLVRYKFKGVSVSGRVVQGRVRSGDKVVVMPLEDLATASRLERNGAPARAARAGDNAEVVLSGVDAARVLVGNVVCKAGGTLPAVRRFNAQIIALPALEVSTVVGAKSEGRGVCVVGVDGASLHTLFCLVSRS